jgi:hypothetical protein
MRFPRAIAIRDDLTVADCMTATGAVFHIMLHKLLKKYLLQPSWKA